MVSAVAWVVLPAVLLALSYGLGVVVERAARVELPPGLRAPVGAGLAVSLTLASIVIGLRDLLVAVPLAALGIAGIVLALRSRLPRPGASALAFAFTYGLYLAPVLLSGHWTWSGYNFVNDTSIQLLLADWLPEHGRNAPPQGFVSTPLDALRSYIFGGYPVGSHALLAAVAELVPVRAEALYQPLVSTFAGLAAMALVTLVRRAVGTRWAVFAACAAMASNLIYQYALQGNMKEIVTAAMIATAAAVAAWSIDALRDAAPDRRGRLLTGSAIALAVPVAAAVNALSTAGGPYVGLVVLLYVGLLAVNRLIPGVKELAIAFAAGAAVLFACVVWTLSTLVTFGEVTQSTYAAPERATDLGHLAGPLSVRQTAGIWLNGDYRFAPVGAQLTLTDLGIWLALALALVAVVFLLRRRRAEVLLFSVPVVLIMLVVTPRVSPYADAKTYMLMAPGVTLLAAVGAAAVGRRWLPAGAVLAGVLAVGVLGSDAKAYHSVQLAPTDRMEAIRDVGRRYAGQGLVLWNEPEEFAKNFAGQARLNVGAETVTPKQTQPRVPGLFAYLWFDFDDLVLTYVEEHPLIVSRRSPAASRPPADYELDYVNEYYEVWRRNERPRILEHMPLQAAPDRVAIEPDCAQVEALAARVRPGERLIAATAPAVALLDTLHAERSPGWRPHPFRAGRISTDTPGQAWGDVAVPESGTYRAYIAGTFGRDVKGYVDGRLIGAAKGVNTIGSWHDIGTVEVTRGRHELRLKRGGGNLEPGDGYSGELGPLALIREGDRPLVRVRPSQARERLCGRKWDWIERVEP
jgi:hypothetical protein